MLRILLPQPEIQHTITPEYHFQRSYEHASKQTELIEIKVYLIKEEIREELTVGEMATTARAVILAAEMSDNAHITEAMATSSEKRILYQLHTNRAHQIPIHLSRRRC